MSLLGLLNQEITLYAKTGYNKEGREAVGSGSTVNARVQLVSKRRLLPNNSLVIVSAIVYVPATTSINTDDKVTYGGVDYKVFSRTDAVGGNGAIDHIKLELIKWQAI